MTSMGSFSQPQTLTFLDEDNFSQIGADTQGTDYHYDDFTLPDRSQSQFEGHSQASRAAASSSVGSSVGLHFR